MCVCPKTSAGVPDFLKNRSDTCLLLSLGSVPAIIIPVYYDFYGRKTHSTVSQCTARFPSMWVVLLYGRTLSNDGPSSLGSLYCQRGKLYGYVPRLWALVVQGLRCRGRQSLTDRVSSLFQLSTFLRPDFRAEIFSAICEAS